MPTTPGVTITGTLENIAGAGNAGTVTFTLVNYGDLLPLISGTALLAPVKIVCQAASDGTFSQALWGTYQISPTNTFYQVTVNAADGSQIMSVGYQFNTAGSFDLSSLTPIPTTPGLPILSIIYPQSSGSTAHNWLNSYDATTGLFTHTQPAFSDLSGSIAASQLIAPTSSTFGAVKSKAASATLFLTGLGTDGVFTTAQPAFTDISGTASAAQIPSLDTSKLTTGQLALARGGTAADLSATGGASQVLKQTSLGGAVTVAQLAFTDISGSVAASQLPNPSATTIGGIESIAAVSHKWINSISTSGVPSLTQPAAADLSDGVTGSGAVVLSTSPSLTTPSLGAATALSITGLTGAFTPNAAGGTDIGSAAKPFANLYIGGSATNNIKVTGTATAARTFTLPDANSVAVQPFGGVGNQFVTSIQSTGQVISARPQASDLQDGTTGSGSVVLATSPTLVTPTLGVASATSINKMAITAPATGSTLAVADGKTLTANNTLTFAGTDGTTLTFQATGTVVNRASTDTLTNKTIDTAGTGNHVQLGGVDLPASIGTNGQVLTNSSGVLAFTTVSGGGGGTPGGATNSIQYNNGSSFSGLLMLSPAGTILPNLVFKNIYKNVTSTGNVDLYTCPANKRAIACEIEVFNNSGNTLAWYTTIKIGGNYFQSTASTNTGNNASGSRSSHYILEAGETIAINADHQPCNVWGGVFEFDNTSNLKSGKITTFIAGDNTVYTVPNGKTAIVLPNTFTPCNGAAGTFSYGNLSGGTRTVTFNLVNSGGTPGTTNQIAASGSVLSPNTTFNPTSVGLTMAAGDFFSINSDANTAGQFGFVTVVEI